MTPLENTPFLSPRNVPLWFGVAMVAILVGLIAWFGPSHG
jgi:hypothetical protein